MGWIRQTPRPHRCALPQCTDDAPLDAEPGDLWRCDTCSRLWEVERSCLVCQIPALRHRLFAAVVWQPASWWQRLRHRPRAKST